MPDFPTELQNMRILLYLVSSFQDKIRKIFTNEWWGGGGEGFVRENFSPISRTHEKWAGREKTARNLAAWSSNSMETDTSWIATIWTQNTYYF